jgi:hypothetical protein
VSVRGGTILRCRVEEIEEGLEVWSRPPLQVDAMQLPTLVLHSNDVVIQSLQARVTTNTPSSSNSTSGER